MKPTRQWLENELRSSLLPLVDACPGGKCQTEDCPWFAVRKRPRAQRLRWFNGLSHDDGIFLAAYHHVCLQEKFALAAMPKRAAVGSQFENGKLC